jgi:hypothetical protein
MATVALAFVTQDLIPASGDRDRTISPSAAGAFVNRAAASIASRTNVRDDRETPLDWAGRARYTHDFNFWKSELFSLAPLEPSEHVEASCEMSFFTHVRRMGRAQRNPSLLPRQKRWVSLRSTHPTTLICSSGTAFDHRDDGEHDRPPNGPHARTMLWHREVFSKLRFM